jgi:hypothetical protein
MTREKKFEVLVNMARAFSLDSFIDSSLHVADFDHKGIEASDETHSRHMYIKDIRVVTN